MKFKVLALGILASSVMLGQAKPSNNCVEGAFSGDGSLRAVPCAALQKQRVCHKGYTLRPNGHCVGEFPASDGCNVVTRDQDDPSSEVITAMVCVNPGDIVGWTGDTVVPAAQWEESIKDGTYVATFIDPQNKWRCYATSYIQDDPRNAFGSAINSITFTCVNPHVVQTVKP